MRFSIAPSLLLFAASLSLPALADLPKAGAGKMALTGQGTPLGTVSYSFDAKGGSKAEVALQIPGQPNIQIRETVLVEGGVLKSFKTDAGNQGTITAEVKRGEVTVHVGTQTLKQIVPPKVLPFGNFSPHLLTYAVAAYDSKKGGAQNFDFLMVEGGPGGKLAVVNGFLKKGISHKDAKGNSLTDYDAKIKGVVIKANVNSVGHVIGWEVPAQKYKAEPK